tara:strand:+ start:642 stop:1166 length:525 start_codon:yes stop_codon:yes gene_type:complete
MKKIIFTIVINCLFITSVSYAGAHMIEKEKTSRALECLALNIYFETRASSLVDAMSVSDVVMNRVKSTRFPNTVCEVVQEGPISDWWKKEKGKEVPIRHQCQFSWFCDGKSDIPKNKTAWEKSRKYARDIYVHGSYIGITEGATHYHANYVKPYWAPSMDRITRIGSHIFYRQK